MSHRDQLRQSKKDTFSAILAVLVKFLGHKKFQEISPPELFEIFGKITCNSFTICDSELQSLGKLRSAFPPTLKISSLQSSARKRAMHSRILI